MSFPSSLGRSASVACVALALALSSSSALAQSTYVVTGSGASIPAAGAGDGTWPNVLPTQPGSAWASAHPPIDACTIDEVRVHGLTHSWVGDLHIVLVSPSNRRITLAHRPGFDGANLGNSGDCTGGTYIFVPQSAGGASVPTSGDWLPGTYKQSYGAGAGQWPSGVNSIFNLALSSTVAEWGLWKLEVYDWASGDTGSFSGWEFRGRTGLPFEIRGPGGPIPASSSGGGGTWPASLPPAAQISTGDFAPPGTARFWTLEIQGLSHTWCGDMQAVLYSPSNVGFTIFSRPGFNGLNLGNSGDCTGGNYLFTKPFSGGSSTVPSSGDWLPSAYQQHYGDVGGEWPTGTAGIYNESIEAVLGGSGSWKLAIYDWAAGDTGQFTGWKLTGWFLPAPPLHSSTCAAGTTGHGCSASINALNQPSLTNSPPCTVQVSNVEGAVNGLIFYGVAGFTSFPLGGGSLCVAGLRMRTALQPSGGTAGSCNGAFALDWDAFRATNPAALGQPFRVGSTVTLQAWFRDPGTAWGTNLSGAVMLTHLP